LPAGHVASNTDAIVTMDNSRAAHRITDNLNARTQHQSKAITVQETVEAR
jgi:hypothetical protein